LVKGHWTNRVKVGQADCYRRIYFWAAATLLNYAPSITCAPLLPRLVQLLKVESCGHMSRGAAGHMILHCMVRN